jgi:hypothetical protein
MSNENRIRPGPRWELLSAGETLGNEGRPRWASYHWRGAAFPNDTKGDSDGSKRIQTATGGDNPQTAGETPTENFHTHKEATEERGR